MAQEMTTVRPWDRLERETTKAWAAFQTYLLAPSQSLDGKRSQQMVADALGIYRSQVAEWSTKNNWIERTAAYDIYSNTKITLEVREVALKELQEEVISKMSQQLVALNKVIDRELHRMIKAQEEGKELDTGDIKRVAEALLKKDNMARRVAMLPTDFMSDGAKDKTDDDTVYVIGG